MTEKQKQNETAFAAKCIVEKWNEMLANGEISKAAYDEAVAKVKSFA